MATPKKSTSGLKAPNRMSETNAKAPRTRGSYSTQTRVGEGTTVLPLPSMGSQHARSVQSLQANSNKSGKGIFK
jgi:hypothetical protein